MVYTVQTTYIKSCASHTRILQYNKQITCISRLLTISNQMEQKNTTPNYKSNKHTILSVNNINTLYDKDKLHHHTSVDTGGYIRVLDCSQNLIGENTTCICIQDYVTSHI